MYKEGSITQKTSGLREGGTSYVTVGSPVGTRRNEFYWRIEKWLSELQIVGHKFALNLEQIYPKVWFFKILNFGPEFCPVDVIPSHLDWVLFL